MSLRRRIAIGIGAASVLITASCGSMVDADAELVLGFPGGIGPTDVPAVLALQSMEDDGTSTTFIEFDSPDVHPSNVARYLTSGISPHLCLGVSFIGYFLLASCVDGARHRSSFVE